MAARAFFVPVAVTNPGSIAGKADPIAALGTVSGADQTAVEAAIALLEADGAAPTQGHVNSLRTVWNTMKTDIAAVAVPSGGLYAVIDTAAITKKSQLKTAIDALSARIDGSDVLTRG